MWDNLKKNKSIVKAYEAIFTPIHWWQYKISHLELPSMEKCHYSFGKLNKGKKFYVIKYNRPECGVFSMIFHLIPQIEYAIHKKYIPIIDCRETYLPMLQDKENAGKENAWDYYFEQPKEFYSLDEVYQSKHVIFVRKNALGIKKPISYTQFPMPEDELRYWSTLFNKYIRINSTLEERVNCEKKALFPQGKKILGVSIRAEYRWGGLIKHQLFYQHPKVADCKTYIHEITKMMEEWDYDYFFLACDEREYSETIANHFGERCLRMTRPLFRLFENGLPLPEEEMHREFAGYTVRKKTEDYITETYLLSQCDSLYTCIGSGVQFAYLINGGKYKHMKVYNAGLWSKEDLQK